jgi:uncharacterized protein (TIGR03435 family)
MLATLSLAQTLQDDARFEVSSVRLSDSSAGSSVARVDSGRVEFRQVFIKDLVIRAFRIPPYQVVWPPWLSDAARVRGAPTASYDIIAKLPAGAREEQVPEMLRTLLRERFALKTHPELRALPAYVMELSKRGNRMPPAKASASNNVYRVSFGAPEALISGVMDVNTIGNTLRNELDRPMINRTGLSGSYEIDLRWDHEVDRSPGVPPGNAAVNVGNRLSLFRAMEEQLGIHVTAQTVSLEMLVIDHLERVPTEN